MAGEREKGLTPEEAAKRIEPTSATRQAADDADPREELGDDQPESSAQKQPEPAEHLRR